MKKVKVNSGGNGSVRIHIKKKRDEHSLEPEVMMAAASDRRMDAISIPISIINQMELRVESVFRPNQQDVEAVYALSGVGKMADQLHNLSSQKIVTDATSEMISYLAENMVDFIREERMSIPRLVIHVHTHPYGIPSLSDTDKRTMTQVAKSIRKDIPDASVFFGVHAVSNEYEQTKTQPEIISDNLIGWSSITRLHKVAFFDENSRPISVSISNHL